MTFQAYETSAQSAAPIELYVFTVGIQTFRFTSAPTDVTLATQLYTAVQIERSEIEDTGDIPKAQVSLDVFRDFPVADLFRVAPPSEVIVIDIYRLHLDDPDLEKKLLWTGRVLNCEWNAKSQATLTCESLATSLRRRGLRRLYQRQCPHVLYGPACGLSNTAWKTTVTLDSPFSAVSGTTISDPNIDAQPDGYFAGGYLEWESSPGVIERRGIRSHVGADIELTHPIVGLVAGATIDLFAGCDHSKATCATKFANLVNYGGFPYVPKKNPFGGSNPF